MVFSEVCSLKQCVNSPLSLLMLASLGSSQYSKQVDWHTLLERALKAIHNPISLLTNECYKDRSNRLECVFFSVKHRGLFQREHNLIWTLLFHIVLAEFPAWPYYSRHQFMVVGNSAFTFSEALQLLI